jgi:hypothetical protein
VQSSAEHEGEEGKDDEDALPCVDDDPHPHALPPPRGIAAKEDVRHHGGGDRPRLVQMVETVQYPVGYKVAPPEDAPHSRQQKPPKEQVLAEHAVEDQLHDDHRVPAPVSAQD